jgi:glycosyltransferase involved in cell wall biosynthesis
MPERLLYYCPCASGGIFDYACAQVRALAECGVEVTLLTAGSCADLRSISDVATELHDETGPMAGPKLIRWAKRALLIRRNIATLQQWILERRFRHVLMATFSEYGSPLWYRSLQRLSASGIRFAAILHDPVRDYVVGPPWFHRLSVRLGYSFLCEAFVHEVPDRNEAAIPDHIRVSQIPHGPYSFPSSLESGALLRKRLGIPAHAKLLLSFGQIRDGKNLDRVIRALMHQRDLWLLVAGKEAGGKQQPVTFYQELARTTGVADRCRWTVDYIPPHQVATYFEAADLVLLTYSRRFRSASGVLNAAVHFRRPCLASSGAGALRTQVERYRLGIWVEPDSDQAIGAGLEAWLCGIGEPDWSQYIQDNSWRRNAEIVMQNIFKGNEYTPPQ